MTTPRDHLRALLDAQPAASAVTVPTPWLEALLAETVAPVAPLAAPDLLTVDQAAARLGICPGTLYRQAKLYPFTRKISHRVLRFDAAELAAWLRTRGKVA